MGTICSNYFRMPDSEDEPDMQPETGATRDKVLKPMKRYLALTGQCWSFSASESASESIKKRVLYGLFAFAVAGYALFYFVYTLYFFGSTFHLGYYFIYYPVTMIDNAMWEFRWFVTCWLGIFLTRGIWLQTFEKNIKNVHLSEKSWRQVKYFSWFLGGALIVMWLASEFQILWEMNLRITRFIALSFSFDALLTLIDRILAFPLFFLFCVTVFILSLMLEDYRDDIVKWEKIDENSARLRFREIKAAIRTAGLSFEVYLMIHFLFLMVTFFLGVCACFEQMEVKIAENSSIPLPLSMPQYARFVNFYGNDTFNNEFTIGDPGTRSAILLTASHPTHPYLTRDEAGKEAMSGINSTHRSRDLIRTQFIKTSMKSVAISSIVKTLESLMLYFIPIALMVRLQNRLREVYEVIEDSVINEQKNEGFLFDNVETIRRMCKYVKTGHGLKIFGYTVPTFQAFILAAFGPFIAVVTQRLLLHIHMKS